MRLGSAVWPRAAQRLVRNIRRPDYGMHRRPRSGTLRHNQHGSRTKSSRGKFCRCLSMFPHLQSDQDLVFRVGTRARFGKATARIPGIGTRWQNWQGSHQDGIVLMHQHPVDERNRDVTPDSRLLGGHGERPNFELSRSSFRELDHAGSSCAVQLTGCECGHQPGFLRRRYGRLCRKCARAGFEYRYRGVRTIAGVFAIA